MFQSIIEDLKEDDKREFKDKGGEYLFSSSVNYPNNKSLVRQNVYVDKNGNITKTEVVDKDGNAQIIMKFERQEFNKKFDKDYFELSSLLKTSQKFENSSETKKDSTGTVTESQGEQSSSTQSSSSGSQTNSGTQTQGNGNNEGQNEENDVEKKETATTSSIEDIVYPMYLPDNTYLTSQERVNTKDGERLILTFGGDCSFILVEEVSKVSDDGVVIPVSGEFDFLTDVIGIIGSKSLSWYSNGIDYYMASDVIETSELIDIARSISVLPVSK